MTQRDSDIENAARIVDVLRLSGDRWLTVLAIACDAAIRHADDLGLAPSKPTAPRAGARK